MAFQLAEAYVDLEVRDQKLDSSLARVRGKVDATYSHMERMSGAARNLFAMVGVGSLGLGFAEIVKAAGKAEHVVNVFRATLAANELDVDRTAESIDGLAASLMRLIGVEDEQVRSLATQAVRLGAQSDELKDLITTSYGLADALGGEENAMQMLLKAREGNWRMLERTLPVLKGLHTNEEKLAKVQELAAQGMKIRAESSHDLEGSTSRLKVAMNELAESAGAALAPALTKVMESAADMFKSLTTGTEENEVLTLKLAKAWLTVASNMLFVQETARDMIDSYGKYVGGGLLLALMGDSKEAGKRMLEIGAQMAALDDAINKHTGAIDAQKKADNDLTVGRLKNLHEVESKNKDAFTKIEDVWRNAQKAAAGGGDVFSKAAAGGGAGGVAAAAAAAGGGAAPGEASTKAAAARGEIHDREWHRKNAQRTGNYLGSIGDDPEHQKLGQNTPVSKRWMDKLERTVKEHGRSSDIAEFGTEAAAKFERWKASQREALKKQLAQAPDEESWMSIRDSYKRRMDAEAKRAGGAIAAEKKRLGQPEDVEAEGLRGALQNRFGLPQGGQPIMVETKEGDKLLQVLTALQQMLPGLNASFGE